MSKVMVIAEVGINHDGELLKALQLIYLAHQCGCDAVKFQKRTVDVVYPPAVQAQPRVSRWGTTVGEQKRGLEFGQKEYEEIDRYCETLGIRWFASAWDVESVAFLEAFHPPYHKVASPMLTCQSVLEAIAATKRLTFISTGMGTMADVRQVAATFCAAGCPFVLMHAVSRYPCPEDKLNLKMMVTLRKVGNFSTFYRGVGYSGHEVSPMPTVLAIGAGAVAVERHLTLDRTSEGSDHAASLERRGMELVVAAARSWEVAEGDGVKVVLPEEAVNAKKLRYWESP